MARSEVRIPDLGETIREALVSRWRKQVGDCVERDEVIAELETDKANVELTASADGRLAEVHVREGRTAAVGALVAVIETDSGVRLSAPSAPVIAPGPRVYCLRCGSSMEPAHSAGGRMQFAGEPVHLLVCRKCGHVEMIAEDPARF